ncbi:cytochrome-c oxidase, cbb3-type subunit III [soil metagenome]
MSDKHIDEATGVSTTGHEWDGIRELNNPLPRWWVWTFYATIVWALAYTIAYPAWPLLHSATTGLLGYSSRGDIKDALAAADSAKTDYVAAVKTKSVDEILADDGLRPLATAAGEAAFKVNCVQCHGSGAQGSQGFPNLNDDDWLWGGSIQQIFQTVSHGVRFTGDVDTRSSEMPGFGQILTPIEVRDAASFVATLSGMPADAEQAVAGKAIFATNCVACHGADGKGNQELGAPNLTDAISLYIRAPDDIARQISHPRHGVMPAWSARLGDVKVKELAVYVHSLGGSK